MTFDRLHVLVFVIGSLFSGVAVDYGVYIYMQPSLHPDEPYSAKLRRLLKPLLASCLTTTIGFSLLLFSDLPHDSADRFLCWHRSALRPGGRDALFRATRPTFPGSEKLSRPRVECVPNAKLKWLPHVLFGAARDCRHVGPWRLSWRDDIRELEIPASRTPRQ